MSLPVRGPLGVIVVAAGTGTRFGAADKALFPLAGMPLIEHSLRLFQAEPTVAQIVAVFGEHTLERGAMLLAALRLRDASVTVGGATRGASVRAGLHALDPDIHFVAVHDAARPLATRELFTTVVAEARRHGAAIPALPVTDTIVEVGENGLIRSTLSRPALRAVQTPQVMLRAWLDEALASNLDATDEGSLLHQAGFPVAVVPGDERNLKITHRDDIALAERWLQEQGT